MAYADIQLFMEKLKHLINCNDNSWINIPSIIHERPQFQLLYDDLASMIQTLFMDEHQDHDKLNDLKKRFTDAAEEAQYIVDLFLSGLHARNVTEDLPISKDFNHSINLDDVRRTFNSVKVELTSMIIDGMKILDSSRRSERTLSQSAPAPISTSRNSLGSKKLSDEIFVGLDRDAELIRGKLVEDQKKVDVVSIVGMGGIGKTTLATKVFNDDYVKYHFYVRVWVTVSQTYDKRDVLIQILESIRAQLDLEKASESELRLLVHRHLMDKRYLIVIDDIWHTETWDSLKLFFPHDNNGSRILLTSRLTEVAKHANSDGLIHHLGYLNEEKSWELLCEKVFHGNDHPEWSTEPGMQIVKNCKGIPLAVVVIAGVLAKGAWSKEFWLEIAYSSSSYIVDEQNGCLETLALSYNHLPSHMRECFLYLGGFPEDYMLQVHRLIWLWIAEGFIHKDGNQCLEDIAEGYLMDLIDRNLVIVAERRNSDGVVRACKVHDLVRELCMKKAKDEKFALQTERLILPSYINAPPYKPVRMFINNDIDTLDLAHPPSQCLQSFLCFGYFRSLGNDIAKCFRSFVLLRVLDLQNHSLKEFPKEMEWPVHLRYLALWNLSEDFPTSICNLWNLQTLVYITNCDPTVLPSNISDLVNLRHFWCTKMSFYLPSINQKPMNLQSISGVVLEDNFQKCFPYIKELRCTTFFGKVVDFESLACLERLKLSCLGDKWMHQYTFPTTLKTLVLVQGRLTCWNMSAIHSLPNLQVLKLYNQDFEGRCWNTYGQEFRQLKFLKLNGLNIEVWKAYSPSFPCLRQLKIAGCYRLEELPLEIGDIPTLELIQIVSCRQSVSESVRRIQEEQHDSGNYDLKIHVSHSLSFVEPFRNQ